MAPAYSLAAALAFVVLAVGLQAPIVMLLAFVPMLFIAIGYQQLNKADARLRHHLHLGHQGVRAQDRVDGRLGHHRRRRHRHGQPGPDRRPATCSPFFGAYGLAASKWWTLLRRRGLDHRHGAICYIGIEISAAVQYGLLGIELVMLIVFSITALAKVYGGSAPAR